MLQRSAGALPDLQPATFGLKPTSFYLFQFDELAVRSELFQVLNNRLQLTIEPNGNIPVATLPWETFRMKRPVLALLTLCAITMPAVAEGDVNLYSSRHYDTDEAFYDNFEQATGITVNRIEDNADVLIERMRSEGELGAADILITVDAGRLRRADEAGLLQPFGVPAVAEKVPANLRAADDRWAAISTRARVIFYDKSDVTDPPQTYQDLADPKYKGKVCTRSSSDVYMLGLMSAIIAHDGEAKAREWAAGVVANLARAPQGGDTDQLRAIVSGVCDIALANHYYYARALRSEVEGLTDGVDRIGVVFPNQATTGTHVNISGFAIARYSPNPENARRFVEYMLTPEAQKMIADGNNEFPVLAGSTPSDVVQGMGEFRKDPIAVEEFASNNDLAQRIYNEVGYP